MSPLLVLHLDPLEPVTILPWLRP